MKKLFVTILTLQLCIAAFSQQNLPSELKGNWLNFDQGSVLHKKFNFKGIPYFVLIDKTGKIQEGEAPRPSSKIEVRERLDELLK